MKMKLLSVAMLASLGVAGTAQAVHVNPDGLGQVLLYPYYTTQNNYETYVSVVNTQDTVKAVKVRIREGMNSQEVLDFNLYLSPRDEWTGKIFKRADTGVSAILTTDTSCISGAALDPAGQQFVNTTYLSDNENSLDRASEGYIEIIEMGNIADSALAAAATHVAGVPANCTLVRNRTKDSSDAVNQRGATTTVGQPTGGLYGYASTIAVGSGLRTTYDAVALDDFFRGGDVNDDLHYPPGTSAPTLDEGDQPADIFVNGNVTTFASTRRIDNISALFMHNTIMNDYVIDSGRNSSTNWIVTFPTKWAYVNGATPIDPFTEVWDPETGTSCDPITINYWDREENEEEVGAPDFSPFVPGDDTRQLCHEVNTISINRNSVGASANTLYGAVYTHNGIALASGYELGWMEMNFTAGVPQSEIMTDFFGLTMVGLPSIGFAAFTSENTLSGGLSNYMGSTNHKGTRLSGQQ